MNKKKVLVLAICALIILFMFSKGMLTYRGLCGWITPKSVNCDCIGIVETRQYDNPYGSTIKKYCTGINLSYNKLGFPLFFMPNYSIIQIPTYNPEYLRD
jgi:hypothetical protein